MAGVALTPGSRDYVEVLLSTMFNQLSLAKAGGTRIKLEDLVNLEAATPAPVVDEPEVVAP